MKNFLNYLGQFRIYSALDLLILLIAAGASDLVIIGGLLLNFGFMAHLEIFHRHNYRKQIAAFVPLIFYIPGLLLFGKIEGLVYIGLGHLYVLKKGSPMGLVSPLVRALQVYVLTGAIAGYGSTIAIWALLLIAIRNFMGDLRDISRDETEGVRTLATALGLKNKLEYGHLIALFLTTIIWWRFTSIGIAFLLTALLLEWLTYKLTEREIELPS